MSRFQKNISLVFLLMTVSFRSHAQREAPETDPQKRTSLNFSLGGGTSYASLLNQNGKRAVFQGYPIAADLDFSFGMPDLGLSFGILAHLASANYSNLANSSGNTQEIQQTESLFGFKISIQPFFVGASYGSMQSKIKDSTGINIDANAPIIGFTAGMKLFSFSESWHLGVQTWYKNAFIQRSNNPALTDNTVQEKIDIFLYLSINPLITAM